MRRSAGQPAQPPQTKRCLARRPNGSPLPSGRNSNPGTRGSHGSRQNPGAGAKWATGRHYGDVPQTRDGDDRSGTPQPSPQGPELRQRIPMNAGANGHSPQRRVVPDGRAGVSRRTTAQVSPNRCTGHRTSRPVCSRSAVVVEVQRCKLERLPSSAGIAPVNWLLLRYSQDKLDRLPSSAGIAPVSWLLLRCSQDKLDRLPSSAGIAPVSWLLLRYSQDKLDRLPSSAGIAPVNRLSLTAATHKLRSQFGATRQLVAPETSSWTGCPVQQVSHPSTGCPVQVGEVSAGIAPVSLVSPSWSRLPSSAGIAPVSWLLLRFRCVSLDRLPSSAGIAVN